MPASYLVSGMQGIITQHESLTANWKSAGALAITLGLAIFVATRLFRWEKDEKLKASAKLWVAGVMVPFVALGVYQFRTNEQIVKNRMLWRQLQRGDAFLIRNAKVFVGDGRVIETGSVLVRKGRIEGVYEGAGTGRRQPEGRRRRGVGQDGDARADRRARAHRRAGRASTPTRRISRPSTSPSARSRSISTAA